MPKHFGHGSKKLKGIESVVYESAYHVIGLKTPSLWVTLISIPGLHGNAVAY